MMQRLISTECAKDARSAGACAGDKRERVTSVITTDAKGRERIEDRLILISAATNNAQTFCEKDQELMNICEEKAERARAA